MTRRPPNGQFPLARSFTKEALRRAFQQAVLLPNKTERGGDNRMATVSPTASCRSMDHRRFPVRSTWLFTVTRGFWAVGSFRPCSCIRSCLISRSMSAQGLGSAAQRFIRVVAQRSASVNWPSSTDCSVQLSISEASSRPATSSALSAIDAQSSRRPSSTQLATKNHNRKEVHRNDGLHVIFKEGPPSLRWRFAVADHVIAHARFAEGNATLEQFAVNPRCAPERVLAAHRAYQGSEVHWDRWSSRVSPSNFACPEQAKALAMPADHRRRLHRGGTRWPILPDRRQPGPQESISGGQIRPLHRSLRNTELMTKGQNLKLTKRRAIATGSQESRRQRHQRRRTRESKEERQPQIYQQLRNSREPLWCAPALSRRTSRIPLRASSFFRDACAQDLYLRVLWRSRFG